MGRLKSHPYSTNMTTAFLMMMCGDVLAQNLEKHEMEKHMFQKLETEEERNWRNSNVRRRVSLRRYRTNLPKHSRDDDRYGGKILHEKGTIIYPSDKVDENLLNIYLEKVKNSLQGVKKHIYDDVDPVRTASMAAWAGIVHTPGMMMLYKVMGKIFPIQNTFTLFLKLAATCVYSVPNNAAFFVYGTCVHHVVEWYDKVELARAEFDERTKNADIKNLKLVLPQFDIEGMIDKARRKIDSELFGTFVNSAKLWVPFHFFNFTVIPVHLRPIAISATSLVWNCYLSLVQHRDIVCKDGEGEQNLQ